MPKIRGVKPEFWTDDDIVELSIPARLLFIGIWNYSCDNGHIQDKSRQIKMRIMPGDDVNVAELLREIEAQGLIERGDGWITTPNLTRHQKPHKSWWATCEKPGCTLPQGTSHAPSNRGATVAQPGPTVDQQGRNSVATADVDVDCEVDGDGELMVTSANADDAPTSATLIAEWIEHCSERPPSRVVGQVSKEVKTMLTEGIDYERVRAGLAEWNRKGLHPSTLASVVHEVANKKPAKKDTGSTTDERVRSTLAIAERLREQEQAQQPHLRAIGENR